MGEIRQFAARGSMHCSGTGFTARLARALVASTAHWSTGPVRPGSGPPVQGKSDSLVEVRAARDALEATALPVGALAGHELPAALDEPVAASGDVGATIPMRAPIAG